MEGHLMKIVLFLIVSVIFIFNQSYAHDGKAHTKSNGFTYNSHIKTGNSAKQLVLNGNIISQSLPYDVNYKNYSWQLLVEDPKVKGSVWWCKVKMNDLGEEWRCSGGYGYGHRGPFDN